MTRIIMYIDMAGVYVVRARAYRPCTCVTMCLAVRTACAYNNTYDACVANDKAAVRVMYTHACIYLYASSYLCVYMCVATSQHAVMPPAAPPHRPQAAAAS